MKNSYSKLFDKWWIFLIFWIISIVFLILDIAFFSKKLTFFNLSLTVFSIILLITSTIYQFIKSRWVKGIFSALPIGLTFIIFILAGIFFKLWILFVNVVDGDQWANNLTIPKNIELHLPLGEKLSSSRPDSVSNIIRTPPDFEIYNFFQPGLYLYDVWLGKTVQGSVYLKAFEITQEYALSEKSLKEASIIQVFNSTDTVIRFESYTDFVIYEGDWGYPYAARFELWFKPSDKSKPEIKLKEKIYKIEGWQR